MRCIKTYLESLSLSELLDELEDTVKWWHYDPHGDPQPLFTVEEIRYEIKQRVNGRT